MTIHYHGTPITPQAVLKTLAGCHFCVSYARPDDVELCHKLGQSVMLDNGAFSIWRAKASSQSWTKYHIWCESWLTYPTTWAVIPDAIDGSVEEQEWLIRAWPFKHRGAPVWHMNEPLERLLYLCDKWPKVCIGSTSIYSRVLSDRWEQRMDEVCNELSKRHKLMPWLHMLRGMACSGKRWPFASVDSSDIGRNHKRMSELLGARRMAERWDAKQCPPRWINSGFFFPKIEEKSDAPD